MKNSQMADTTTVSLPFKQPNLPGLWPSEIYIVCTENWLGIRVELFCNYKAARDYIKACIKADKGNHKYFKKNYKPSKHKEYPEQEEETECTCYEYRSTLLLASIFRQPIKSEYIPED